MMRRQLLPTSKTTRSDIQGRLTTIRRQEAVPALSGRKARGAPPRWSQAGDRDQGADARSNDAERAVVARLCVGSADLRSPLPHLNRVDDCTRECLALVADTSLSGIRVGRELDRLMIE